MFGNNGQMDEVVKLAKGLVASHHEPVDHAFEMAYRYVYGKYAQRQPRDFEGKVWKCQDYRAITPDEYATIKRCTRGIGEDDGDAGDNIAPQDTD